MSDRPEAARVQELYEQLDREAARGGYNLNPDKAFTLELVESLLTNVTRYGYPSCPCRLAAGARDEDLDIICPCDYRDPDLTDYGACYCALYVSGEIARGEKEAGPVPERRRKGAGRGRGRRGDTRIDLPYPVWRCPVCGYLCARDHPPEKCPVCRADRDRFERFL